MTATDEQLGYLAALIDGEGTVSFAPSRARRKDGTWRSNGTNRQVRIYNSDQTLLDEAATILRSLGIGYSQSLVNTRPGQKTLTICGKENLRRLNSAISLRSKTKADKLERMANES